MSYELENRLVVGVASSALFDLAESDCVFRDSGEQEYRRYQEQNLDRALEPGVALGWVRRLLSLNDLAAPEDPLVEVIVLSRNDPDTGLRVMRSIATHDLPITRAIFMQGRSPYRFIPALNMSLFLSANEEDVREAVRLGFPGGQVLRAAAFEDDHTDRELRIAFDFDGVLADDESERVTQRGSVDDFQNYETANARVPHNPGPLLGLLRNLNRIQRVEQQRKLDCPEYQIRVRISIVTARGAPAHERAMASLKHWGVLVNDAFFLGGVEKRLVLEVLRPHMFFDDQSRHLEPASLVVPCVHVPFGIVNQ
ncbi:5'-nucleotidase [Kutzneria viridogrisea]|uniref:5'-nucleotidase n=1 Tax=Kutzneria viridogrisea TaxID=47990 RepID=A0ABR6BCH2_9PSEU|nr:5'-nucleotidase [Kutzneria viridogrisea]